MTPSYPRRPAALLLALVLTACSGGGGDDTAADRSPTPSPSASPTPSPSPTPAPSPPLASPLTGMPVDELRPVVAVKVDNAPLARPQTGLERADVVYEEIVEGGTTRFLAIYSSQGAPTVGPVRSVRESDLELLAAYGRVAFAFSGGNSGVKATVRKSNVIDVSYDARPGAYWRAGRRRDAINYMTSTQRLLQAAGNSATAKDVGFHFTRVPSAAGARPASQLTVRWPRATTGFTYDAGSRRWLRSMDGRPAMLRGGGRMSASTVIVQQVRVKPSRYADVTGANSPYTVTSGSGTGYVLRDGVMVPMRWRRSGTGPTEFLDSAGQHIGLKPGPVWIVLAPSNSPVVIR